MVSYSIDQRNCVHSSVFFYLVFLYVRQTVKKYKKHTSIQPTPSSNHIYNCGCLICQYLVCLVNLCDYYLTAWLKNEELKTNCPVDSWKWWINDEQIV